MTAIQILREKLEGRFVQVWHDSSTAIGRCVEVRLSEGPDAYPVYMIKHYGFAKDSISEWRDDDLSIDIEIIDNSL